MQNTNLLQGDQVRLTALSEEDLPLLWHWYQDAGFLRLLNATPAQPRSKKQLRSWIENSSASDRDMTLAIRTLDDDRLLGYVELDGILWNQGVASLSIAIGNRDAWGRGYGREALALILRFAFQELNLHRIGITVFSYNQRAIALYESLGFQKEGAMREFVHRDGQRHDMLVYGLLRHEWRAPGEEAGN
ncbi:MAG: GNAT family protein [Chloroflexota bacterium]|nr:GNAT family protein [Chloroflexota bacterium]